MQTFLPYSDFARSASVLDDKRLGKQRVEAYQILITLTSGRKAWSNHPAVKMWRGHETHLLTYIEAICHEWHDIRGFKDTVLLKSRGLLETADNRIVSIVTKPAWLGDESLHRSHQSNLIRKDAGHYTCLFPDVPDDLEYVWPV